MDKLNFSMPELERINRSKSVYPPSVVERHQFYNACLNFLFCLLVLWYIDCDIFKGFNILILGGSFIIFDIAMGFLDNYISNIKPYILEKNNTRDIIAYEKYVKYLEKKLNKCFEIAKKKSVTFCKECPHRDYSYHPITDWHDLGNTCEYGNKNEKQCTFLRDLYYWREQYNKHKAILDKMIEEEENKKIESNTQISSDYNDKLQYFKDLKQKYSLYVKNQKCTYLQPIVTSLKKLIKLIEKKPMGLTFIPNTVYIYLDELQAILAKLNTLDKDKQNRYTESIEKIATALSENIESINKRIDEFEVGDIEVSLNVLYQELVKEDSDNV